MARARAALASCALLLCVSCGGEVLQRLETDIAALRERIQAREEVRIQMVSATAPPQTKTGQLATPTEPHVSVGCPPATVVTVVEPRKPRARSPKARQARSRKHARRG
jgi:hypothetical protein